MPAIDLVLYFTKEKARVFTVEESTDKLTVLELKSRVHEFIVKFIEQPEYSHLSSHFIDREFTEYEESLEKLLISNCDLQVKYPISDEEQELEQRLLYPLHSKHPTT